MADDKEVKIQENKANDFETAPKDDTPDIIVGTPSKPPNSGAADQDLPDAFLKKIILEYVGDKVNEKKFFNKLRAKYEKVIEKLSNENQVLKEGIAKGTANVNDSQEYKKLLSESDKLKIENDKLKIENMKLQTEASKFRNEYYKAFADTKNLRNTIMKENDEAKKYRAEGFVDSLTPILDNFYFALCNEVTNEEVKKYQVGFSFVYKNLSNVLEQDGLKIINPEVGSKFDSSNMEAVETRTIEDNKTQPNTVVKVMSQGYVYIDHLLKPAKVVVAVSKNNVDNQQSNSENKIPEQKTDENKDKK